MSSVRGGLAGVAMAALAVAAHGFAGGGYPGSSGLMLLVMAAAAVGAAAAALRPPAALPILMVAGQPACHLALSGLVQHGHAAGAMEFSAHGPMLIAHAVAAVGCAFLILITERLYELISRAVRVLLTRPGGLPARAPLSRRPHSVPDPKTLLALGAAGPRAPPVTA
ncbi:hypothetical protein [Nocardia aurantiaca]|uniref:Uncharacterized protein n=1 Tax=Nocardia aurantiaca TaxID=2675850 RepID=A0A6I3KRP2_9NOCA|nr:hypothetical protein [Nocardia aurantiaca]MTE11981.1 hypothetical protein [Nocardia aurantiaca]